MKISVPIPSPRVVRRTGDDKPASSLLTYVWRMTEWHQIVACVLAIAVALINLAPLELQRRIVNEVVDTQEVAVLWRFGLMYLALILVHQLLKFGLRLYQGWLTESVSIYTRRHLLSLYANRTENGEGHPGRAVSIVGAEVEKLGGFAGEALSQACANVAMLLGVAVYMLVVAPEIAMFALAFLVPQVILTPLLQRRLNDLTEERVEYMRDLGDDVSDMDGEKHDRCLIVLPQIFNNRMTFLTVKFMMKAALNLMNSLAPLTVLLLGGYLVMQGEVEVGVIVAFISGFERISSPLRELIGFYRVAAQANVQHRLIAQWISYDRK